MAVGARWCRCGAKQRNGPRRVSCKAVLGAPVRRGGTAWSRDSRCGRSGVYLERCPNTLRRPLASIRFRSRFASNICTYERSANPADVARFASISYGFTEQLIAVPEPQSWALMLAGLAFVATVKERRRGTDRR